MPIAKKRIYEDESIGFQKLVARKDIIIIPTTEVKNKDTSVGSYSETFLVMTWYKPSAKAAARGSRALESKIEEVGLSIIRTPMKPIEIATHVLADTLSFKIIADKATTITGANEPTLWAFANDKYLKDNTNKPDSMTDNTLLKICILIFLDL